MQSAEAEDVTGICDKTILPLTASCDFLTWMIKHALRHCVKIQEI